MTTFLYKSLILCFIILSSPGIALTADPQRKLGKICGYLKLDGNWDPSIYLSYIPTFDEMYTISNEHIIAKTEIDSRGYFEFDIGFIPEEDHLFRLHIIKKGDHWLSKPTASSPSKRAALFGSTPAWSPRSSIILT